MKYILSLILIFFFQSASPSLYAEHHKVYEISYDSQEVTRLNKKYPKPQLEDTFKSNKKSGSFYGRGCKGSNKNKEISFYKGNHTIDVFLACRITSPGGYHKHLRKVADKKALEFCQTKYSSKTFYRGPSFVSALDDKFWRLLGDGLALGFVLNKI